MGVVEPIRVPVLYCPFPLAVHPMADMVERESAKFLSRFSLCADRARRAQLTACLPGLAGQILPSGDPDVLQLLSDFLAWLFAFDDVCDEHQPGEADSQPVELIRTMMRMQRVIDAPESAIGDAPHQAYLAALRDIRRRLAVLASPTQAACWVASMRGHFLVEAGKVAATGNGARVDLDDLVIERLQSGGTTAVISLLPVACGIEIPASDRESPPVRALTEMAALLANLASDIFSYAREAARGTDGHNLVDALRTTDDPSSAQQAVRAAARMHTQIMRRFLELGSQVSDAAGNGTPLARYVQSLGHYVSGALNWCGSTMRYLDSAGSPRSLISRSASVDAGVADSVGITDTTGLGVRSALPQVSSIAWWWEIGEFSRAPFEIDTSASEPSS